MFEITDVSEVQLSQPPRETPSPEIEIDELETKLAIMQEKLPAAHLPSIDLYSKEHRQKFESNRREFTTFLTNIKKGDFENVRPVDIEIAFRKTESFTNYSNHSSVLGVRVLPPTEELEFNLFRHRSLYQLQKAGKLKDSDGWVKQQTESSLRYLERVLEQTATNESLLDELSHGGHYLSHGVTWTFLEEVMEQRKIMSRHSQLATNGKAQYNTSYFGRVTEHADGTFETPNGKPVPATPNMLSSVMRERHEVLFSENMLYGNLGTVYIIFPAGILLQNSQFYNQDGIHLFPEEYSDEKSEGYEVDFQNTPHLLVAREENREYLREVVGGISWVKDPEAFLDSIFFMEESDFESPEVYKKVKHIADQQFSTTRARLGEFLLPSGTELNPNQNRNNKNQLLYSFSG